MGATTAPDFLALRPVDFFMANRNSNDVAVETWMLT